MPGLVRASPPEVNEQADRKIEDSNQILPGNSKPAHRFADDDRNRNLDADPGGLARPAHHISGLRPGADVSQALGYIAGTPDRCSLNRFQSIVGADTRTVSRSVLKYPGR